jgi:hypothetical protein
MKVHAISFTTERNDDDNDNDGCDMQTKQEKNAAQLSLKFKLQITTIGTLFAWV